MNQPKKENLMGKRIIDLKEMLERENKLLANKKFIDKLKDKGEKIKKLRDEIERIIKIKESVEETESFLARLSLGDKKILPKHPMFSASKDDIKLAKQSINNQKDSKEVIKEIINGELDIFSVAISRTFDDELSQKRSERFVLNKIYKNLNRKSKEEDKSNKIDDKLNDNKSTNSNKLINNKVIENKIDFNKETTSEQLFKSDKPLSFKDISNKKEFLIKKYKDTALEPLDETKKVIPLTIEDSLEFGKEQKVKDYEVEKLRLEKRLTWRKIIEFDTDESESSSDESEVYDE